MKKVANSAFWLKWLKCQIQSWTKLPRSTASGSSRHWLMATQLHKHTTCCDARWRAVPSLTAALAHWKSWGRGSESPYRPRYDARKCSVEGHGAASSLYSHFKQGQQGLKELSCHQGATFVNGDPTNKAPCCLRWTCVWGYTKCLLPPGHYLKVTWIAGQEWLTHLVTTDREAGTKTYLCPWEAIPS